MEGLKISSKRKLRRALIVVFAIILLGGTGLWFKSLPKTKTKGNEPVCLQCQVVSPDELPAPSRTTYPPLPEKQLRENPLLCLDYPGAIKRFTEEDGYAWVFYSCNGGKSPSLAIKQLRDAREPASSTTTVVLVDTPELAKSLGKDMITQRFSKEPPRPCSPRDEGTQSGIIVSLSFPEGEDSCFWICSSVQSCASDRAVWVGGEKGRKLMQLFYGAK